MPGASSLLHYYYMPVASSWHRRARIQDQVHTRKTQKYVVSFPIDFYEVKFGSGSLLTSTQFSPNCGQSHQEASRFTGEIG